MLFLTSTRVCKPAITLVSALLPLSVISCVSDYGRIQIVEQPTTLEVRRYQENFTEAYYDVSPPGHLRLVLRKRQPAGGETELTQTILVESVWQPIPGVTVANRTQINGTVTYELAGHSMTRKLRGAGSVFYFENDAKDRLEGSLDHVVLEAAASKSDSQAEGEFLHRIELCGEFSARKDPYQALRIANQVRKFDQSAAANP